MDLARLFETEAAPLRRFLARFAGAVSVEDVAQDTFLQLCAARRSEVASPRAYLFAVARNVARDRIRQAQASPVCAVADIETLQRASDAPNPEETRIAAQQAEAVRAALAALPALQREALLLRRVQRLPAAEVARRLGVSERRMQRLVLRAIASCHARLADEGDSAAAID